MAFWTKKLHIFNLGMKTSLTSSQIPFSFNLSTSAFTSKHLCQADPGSDPEINYKGQVEVLKSLNIIKNGEGVHNSIALCNKEREWGCTCPLCPPGSARGIQVVLQPLSHLVPVAIQQQSKLHAKSKNCIATSEMTRQQGCCHTNSTSRTPTAGVKVFVKGIHADRANLLMRRFL